MRWLCLLSFYIISMVTLARSQGTLSAEVLTDRDVYRTGSTNPISVYAHLFGSPNPSGEVTTPRNVAFVLDRSGSMAGPRIQFLRKAVSQAVNSLGARDIVSVVFFGSEIETLVEARRHDELESLDAKLAGVEPSGGSALYDALNQGAALLRRNLSANTVNHLILVTDGPATKGPREAADFTRLAELFAREGITLSSIGIGSDFDEDELATMARIGNGEFYFAENPESLVDQIPAEVNSLRRMVARDVTIQIEFSAFCDKIEPCSWARATIQGQVVTSTLPYVCADREVNILVQVSEHARRFSSKIATLRVSWKDPNDGQSHELVKSVDADFTTDDLVVKHAVNPTVARVLADAMARQGLEDAIEQLDKSDSRRALRALREGREDLYGLNLWLDDTVIETKARQLGTYLASLHNRTLNAMDRKTLRSGIFHQFGIPTTDDASHP